ncbi:MAG: VIT and VWA domain-containing protein [Candidatus Krumholzibacteriota bacterium]
MLPRNSLLSLLFVVLLSVLISPAQDARADGLIVIHDPHPTPWPHPHPRPHYVFAPLEVKYHHVDVKIEDQVAVTEVDQVFANPNNRQLEGTYLFPIPRGAQIDEFSMDIDGRQVSAELLSADKARRIYEDIVRSMKDPALLEYAGGGLFKVRIFPIEPLGEKRVKLKYTELLTRDSGMVEYLYPLNTEKFSAQPLNSVSVKVDLVSNSGLKSLFSPSHEVRIDHRGSKSATVTYADKNVRPDRDFQLLFSLEDGSDVGLNLLTFNPGDDPEGGFFLLLASPAVSPDNGKPLPKDVVFVLDTSGSMAEGGKIDQARRALDFCLHNLNDGDRFEVVRFSTESEPLFGSLTDVTAASRRRARDFVADLQATGGTAISAALTTALEPARKQADSGRPYVVIFLTDGKPTVGVTDPDRILADVMRARGETPVRIFCFGVGTNINTRLLDRITEQTRAVSRYVLPDEDIEIKVSDFYAKISDPVLTNPSLRFGGGIRATKMTPPDLPDVFKGSQLVVCGRYTGAGDVAVELSGMVGDRERTFTYEGTFAPPVRDWSRHHHGGPGDRYGFIPRLWATRRIGYLLDQIRLHGDEAELRDEVVRLARRYGIVTPYTAYLIVEDEERRQVRVGARTLQQFDRDKELQAANERMYETTNRADEGGHAVGGAMANQSLKGARSLSAPSAANQAAKRGQSWGKLTAGEEKVHQAIASQQTRHLAGRTFFNNDGQWIDAIVQEKPEAEIVNVTFGGSDYFALVATHPAANQWLSLGDNLQIHLDGKNYIIMPGDDR